ncbi:MAG: hypothetical protein ACLS3V_01095 [Streptococcus sp.]
MVRLFEAINGRSAAEGKVPFWLVSSDNHPLVTAPTQEAPVQPAFASAKTPAQGSATANFAGAQEHKMTLQCKDAQAQAL